MSENLLQDAAFAKGEPRGRVRSSDAWMIDPEALVLATTRA